MRKGPARLSIHNLEGLVGEDDVDTVLVVFADMQGRLQGKRFDARHFLAEVVENDTEGCSYLLAVDVDMNTVAGYEMSSWESGYGDLVMQPDLRTMRLMPWHEKTAVCQADLLWEDGSPVPAAPRQILQNQAAKLAERGWVGLVATELEFIVFENTYEDAWDRAYRDLTPANRYNVDYSILGTSRVEPLLGRIRREMSDAGMWVESVKGECNYGQHEMAFRYDELVTKADEHCLFKTGAKEIASQEGCSITFMAKYNEREGNSCHIHLSLRDRSGTPLFAGDGKHGMSELFEQFLAGMLACTADLTLLLAPNINSYKRFADGSFAPTALAWGRDNRTCSFRIVGHGDSIRVECRVPGGDVNPYLAIAALVAGGIYGVDHSLELEPEFVGNAYTSGAPRLPRTLRAAADLFGASEVAKQAFGTRVVEHYKNMAEVELANFESSVTDWERYRSFERM
ncbi:MAG: glutamine synthetase family protein [Acidimicrobiales bacterium]